jgi:hypothetical protein
MKSFEGSGKWVLAVLASIHLAVTLAYPEKVYFFLKFIWGLVVLNLGALLEQARSYLHFH